MAATDAFLAGALTQALRAAGVPVAGVDVGDPGDRSTWAAQLDKSATPADAQNAATVIATFDLAGFPARQADADAMGLIDQKVFKALVRWCAQKFSLTPAQARSEILAIYRALP